MAKTEFVSLQDFGTPYESKRGREVRAHFRGFLAGETTMAQAKNSWVVRNFVNIANSVDAINGALGTDFIENEEYGTVPANLSLFFNTKEEAESVLAKAAKGANIDIPVVIYAREYEGKLYLELRGAREYIGEPKNNGGGADAPLRKSDAKTAKKSEGKPMDVSDDDLPF